ncbi:hypothetical protein, partial [Flavobacterium sp.]|uniref:hypothetical protein n=1 Tax=Flavobacterium sp. TaxID=239 RepID=UPI0037C05099
LIDDVDAATARATLGAQAALGYTPLNATAVSAFGLTLIDDADAATARATLGAQAALGYTPLNATAVSAFGLTLIDDADAATARATLGAQAALGYTPVNRAGDTMTGALTLGGGSAEEGGELLIKGALTASADWLIDTLDYGTPGLRFGGGSGNHRFFDNGAVSFSGNVSAAGVNSSAQVDVAMNVPAISNSAYLDGHVELVTTDNSRPRIGFHRAGTDAVALYYDGGTTLRVRGNAGADYGVAKAGVNQFETFGETVNYVGTFATQRIMHNYGWDNGVPRWKWVMENDGAFALYGYDDSGASPSLAFTVRRTVVGSSDFIGFNSVVNDLRGDVRDMPRVTGGLTAGCMYATAAGFTLNTGLAAGRSYGVYNDSGAAITLTQGAGLTLRKSGTATTGNLTLAQRGFAVIWCNSTSEYIANGDV